MARMLRTTLCAMAALAVFAPIYSSAQEGLAGPTDQAGNIQDIRPTDVDLITSLPSGERQKGIERFELARASWLSVKNASARFIASVEVLKDGKYADDPAKPQTGLIEFAVAPTTDDSGRLSPAQVRAHMFNDKGWHFLSQNVFDPNQPVTKWIDPDYNCPPEGEAATLARQAFSTELMFFPFDFMSKTFNDSLWTTPNRYADRSRTRFFATRGMPIRKSTSDEQQATFRGESQFLFLASPAMADAHYWLSEDSGELRRIDVLLPDGKIKSFEYSDYYSYKGRPARYPRKLVLTLISKSGGKDVGWRYTMTLTNVAINAAIPEQHFQPPKKP